MRYVSVPVGKIATEIYPGLWQGGIAPIASGDEIALELGGVDSLALLECEAGVRVKGTMLPLRDEAADLEFLPELHQVARKLAEDLIDGRHVATLCMEGRNRSGLLSGLILYELGMSGADAVKLIRKRRRRNALSTRAFADYLRSL